jgi:hypothetical protein
MGNGTNEHCRSFGKGPMSNAGPSPHVQCKVPSQQPTQCLRPMSGPVMTKWSLMRRRVRVAIGGDYAV